MLKFLCTLLLTMAVGVVGCNIPVVSPDMPFALGYYDAISWLHLYPDVMCHPFGGDASILAFLRNFDLPLVWNQFEWAGESVTESDFETYSTGVIVLNSEPDVARFSQYQSGAWAGLADW